MFGRKKKNTLIAESNVSYISHYRSPEMTSEIKNPSAYQSDSSKNPLYVSLDKEEDQSLTLRQAAIKHAATVTSMTQCDLRIPVNIDLVAEAVNLEVCATTLIPGLFSSLIKGPDGKVNMAINADLPEEDFRYYYMMNVGHVVWEKSYGYKDEYEYYHLIDEEKLFVDVYADIFAREILIPTFDFTRMQQEGVEEEELRLIFKVRQKDIDKKKEDIIKAGKVPS